MIARRTLLQNLTVLSAISAVQLGAVMPAFAEEREEIPLWPGKPPGQGGVTGPEKVGEAGVGLGALSNISVPRMRVYRPEKANGAAVAFGFCCTQSGHHKLGVGKAITTC